MRFLSLVFLFYLGLSYAETYKGYEIISQEKGASLPIILVSPAKLCPTQVTVGRMTVKALVDERFGQKIFEELKFPWEKGVSLENQLKKLQEKELLSYVSLVQSKLSKKAFDGAYFSGGVFHFDGHHRSSALFEVNTILERISPNPKARLFVPVRLMADYSPYNDKQMARDLFVNRKQGYVSNALFPKKKGDELALLKFYYLRKHAPNLASLVDDPYRSLIGQALYEEKVEGDDFVTYFEFYLEEALKKDLDKAYAPVVIRPHMEMAPELVEKTKKVLFTHKRLKDFAYWARFENLSKEEAQRRCQKKEEEPCRKNRLLFESLEKKYR